MASNGISWFLELNTTGFSRGIAGAKKELDGLAKGGFGLSDLLKGSIQPLIATASIGGIYEAIKGTLNVAGELGTEMENLSKQTGMSVSYLYEMREAFDDNGVDAEKLGASVAKMQKFLASAASKGSPLLKSLGLDGKDLASASPEESFRKIGEAINAIPNATQRAAAAMEIFGKSGAQLLSVFSDDQFRDGGNMKNTAALLQQNAALFKEYKDTLEDVSKKSKEGFSVGFGSDFIPRVMPFLKTAEENADMMSRFGELTSAGLVGAVGAGETGADGIGGMMLEQGLKLLEILNQDPNSESPEQSGGLDTSINFGNGPGGMGIIADSMAKIGGGGNTMGGSADPLLAEQQRQTAILMQIRDNQVQRPPAVMHSAQFSH